jgi:hypothetical protein
MSKENLSVEEKAWIFIEDMKRALKNGTKHYDIHGKLLETEREIAEALLKDGRITFNSGRRW